jgi:hypothetical protein
MGAPQSGAPICTLQADTGWIWFQQTVSPNWTAPSKSPRAQQNDAAFPCDALKSRTDELTEKGDGHEPGEAV